MLDGLAAVGAGVDYEAIAAFEMLCAGDFAGGGEQFAEQGGVFGQGLGMGGDVAFGDDEHVHGGLRVEVGEGEGVGVLVQALDGDLAGDDFAEEAVGGQGVGHAVIIVGC